MSRNESQICTLKHDLILVAESFPQQYCGEVLLPLSFTFCHIKLGVLSVYYDVRY